jgi:hypothetical protein
MTALIYLAPACALAAAETRLKDLHGTCSGPVAHYVTPRRPGDVPAFHTRCDCRCHRGRPEREEELR